MGFWTQPTTGLGKVRRFIINPTTAFYAAATVTGLAALAPPAAFEAVGETLKEAINSDSGLGVGHLLGAVQTLAMGGAPVAWDVAGHILGAAGSGAVAGYEAAINTPT